jgi:predicted DNA-binding transcriptional regulator YafY
LHALADACECTTRTVERDLELLLHDYGITYERKFRTYRLTSGHLSPIASWNAEDTIAIALATALLGGSDIPHRVAIQCALGKITGLLSPQLRTLMADAAAVVHVDPGPRDYSCAPVADIAEAAARQKTIELDYESYSSGTRMWRRVDPYQIERRDGQFLELHAWCHKNQAIRAFAVDRIHGVRETGHGFRVDEAVWSLYISAKGIVGGLRGGTPVDVHVRFSPEVAPYACDLKWPDGLSIDRASDGAAILTGMVQGTNALVGDLLRWKRHAVVLGGEELRKAIKAEVAIISQAYGEK